MSRLFIAVVAFITGFSAAGFAQNMTAAQRDACKADYAKYCSGVAPGGGRIIACLNKQHDQLSVACQKVLDAQTKR